MTQEWGAAEEDHQETKRPIQQEELRVVDQSLPASRSAETRAFTSVTPSRFLRPLPPTPTPLGANSAVARSTRECQSPLCYHVPPPSASGLVSPVSDTYVTELNADSDVTEPTPMPFRSKMTEIQGRSEFDRDVGELRSQRVLVPKSSRSTRPLPLLPRPTGATGSTNSSFVESSERALLHDGASCALSPTSLDTHSPLSRPDTYDVPLGINREETSGIGGALDDRESASGTLDSKRSCCI